MVQNTRHSLLVSRASQYVALILILAVLGGGYWYWKNARAAVQTTDNRPSFEAPLTHDLNLTRGQGSATYSRIDGADRRATVTDFAGLIRPVKSGEARFEGARRVENLLSYSEDSTNAAWTKTNASAGSSSTVINGFPTKRVTLTNSNISHGIVPYFTPTIGNAYCYSAAIDVTGLTTKVIILELAGKTASFTWTGAQSITVSGTADTKAYKIVGSYQAIIYGCTSGATVGYKMIYFGAYGSYNAGVGEYVDVTRLMYEDVTGQVNQNPSEYVSTNVKTSSPYHGAGVDGVKYFDTQNGNIIASNVVTEATGTAIVQSTLKGYLAEGARTNLLTYSEQFDNVAWGKTSLLAFGSGSTADATVSPDGKTTAEKIVEDTNLNLHKITEAPLLTAGNTYTASVYAKIGERTNIVLYANSWDAGWVSTGYAKAVFNLSTVAAANNSQSGGLVSIGSTITDVGNGWRRCTMTFSITGGTDVTNRQIGTIIHNGSTDYYTGDGSSGVYLWGAQLEQASFASSYIPTTTASVTRANDNLKYVGASNFNGTAGSITVDVTTEWTTNSGSGAYFIDDSSTLQLMALWSWNGASNHLAADRKGGGGTRNSIDYTGLPITSGTLMKLGHRWNSTATSLFRDGSLRGSDTTLTLPYDSISGISVGIRADVNALAFSTLKNVRAWKKALSDTELNNLTSLTQSTSDSAVKKTTVKAPDNTGLVGYWSFEDGSGTKAEDFSPSGTNTGTLTNGPTWVDGKFGKAVNFDGVNDYVNAETDSALALTDNFTLSAWVNPTSLHTTGYYSLKNVFLYRGDASSSTINYLLQVESNTSITFKKRVFPEGIISYTFTGIPPLTGRWSHVILTVSSGVATLYVDGTNMSSQAIAALGYESGQGVYIGTSIPGGSSEIFFTGKIDDVRIYNRVLSAPEISDLYQTTASTKLNTSQNSQLTSGLVGLWSFNGPDISGTTAYDRSGNANNGTLTNGPTPTIGKVGQSLRFDGTNDYVNIPNTTDLNPGTGNFTVSAWIRIDSTPADYRRLINKGAGSNYYAFVKFPGDNWKFEFHDGTFSTGDLDFGSSTMTYGNWMHLVATVDRTNNLTSGYLNGVLKDTSSITGYGSVTNTDYLSLGRTTAIGAPFSIDETRVYNRALSATEVTALYNLGR